MQQQVVRTQCWNYPCAGEFRGVVNAFRGIVAREGTRGLFAGYGSFLLRDLPFDAIEFVAYEQLKKAYAVRVPASIILAPETNCVADQVMG